MLTSIAEKNLLLQAKRQNFYFGAKLVRGAYMEQVHSISFSHPVETKFDWTKR